MSVDTAFISDDLLFPMILICPTRNPRKQGGDEGNEMNAHQEAFH